MAGEVKRVAIIGAGVMGIQIALKAARKAGNIISLTDISEKAIESSKVREEEILTNMVNTRLISESQRTDQRADHVHYGFGEVPRRRRPRHRGYHRSARPQKKTVCTIG